MRARSFRWLRVRILGLLEVPPSGWREVTTGSSKSARKHSEPVWSTRIQAAIHTTRQGAGT